MQPPRTVATATQQTSALHVAALARDSTYTKRNLASKRVSRSVGQRQ